MAATLQWIVVLVWWSLLSASDLSSGDGYNLFMDANVHTLGLILMLVEGALNWIPIFPSQWVAPIGAGLLYAAYAQVQHLLFSQYVSNRSFWEYSFLDTTAKYAGLWYCGFVLGFFLIFFVVVGLHLVRDRVFRKGKSPDQPEEVTKEDNSFGGNNNNGSSSIETLRV